MDLNDKTVVIRGTNWVGDTVMTLPAIRELRQHHPRARLVVAVRPFLAGLFRWVPEVDEVLIYDRDHYSRRWEALLSFARQIRVCQPDVFICFQNAFEAALLGIFSRARLRIGYARDGRSLLLNRRVAVDPDVCRLHQVYYYLHLLAAVGILPEDRLQGQAGPPEPGLLKNERMKALARRWFQRLGIDDQRPVIGLHAGAFYGSAKRWLPERFAELVQRMGTTFNAQVILFGSRDESSLAENIAHKAAAAKVVNLCGRTTMDELVPLIGHCHLFVSNDSGPMHIAAALQVPQVALFGSTDPVATGPFSPRAVVIKKPVECSPCFLRECPIDLRCFKAITVDETLERISGVLYREYSPER